mgnify:CR=1 FL=1
MVGITNVALFNIPLIPTTKLHLSAQVVALIGFIKTGRK